MNVNGGAEVPITLEFTDLDQAWVRHAAAGPLQTVIEIAGPDAVRTVLTEVLETDRKSDGALRQGNVMRYVIATTVDHRRLGGGCRQVHQLEEPVTPVTRASRPVGPESA